MSYNNGYDIKDVMMMQGECNRLITKGEGLSWMKDLTARS
jgi:hypothetical protein